MIETILDVVYHEGLGSSAKILWIRLYDRYKYESFFGTYEEMADEMNSKRYTVRAQIASLRDIGAISTGNFYENSNLGNTFCLKPPNKWKK